MDERQVAGLRPGDRVRVTSLPHPTWRSPTGMGVLHVGEVVALNDPPVIDMDTPENRGWRIAYVSRYTNSRKILSLHGIYWLPPECAEPIESVAETAPAVCTCDMWVTGCVCGVMAEERRAKS